MEQVGHIALETLILTVNGLLAVGYWLWDHAVVLAAAPLALAVILLYDRRISKGVGARTRRYDRGQTAFYSRTVAYLPTVILAVGWIAVAWQLAFPVTYIGLAMWITLVVLPILIPLEEADIVRRLKWFLGLYIGIAAIFLFLLRSQLNVQALAAWSRTMGQQRGGETLETMIVSSLVPWAALALWALGPLMFFGYAAQRLNAYQSSLRSPWKTAQARIAQIVGRGEVD